MCDKVEEKFVAELDPGSVVKQREPLRDYGRDIMVMTYRNKGGKKYYGRWWTVKGVGDTQTNDPHEGYPNAPKETRGEAHAYALEHANLYFRDLK